MSDNINFNNLGVNVEIFDSVWNQILSQSDYLVTDPTKLQFIRNRDKIQPKLVAGDGIEIDDVTNKISASLNGVNSGTEIIGNQRFLSIPLALKLSDQIDRWFPVAYKVCAQFRGTRTINPFYWEACTMFLHADVTSVDQGLSSGYPFLQFDGHRISYYPGYGSKIDLYDVEGYPTHEVVDIIFPHIVSWHMGIESDWESSQFDSFMEAPKDWANRCALFALEPLPSTGLAVVDGTVYNSVSLRDAFGLFKGIGHDDLNAFLRFTGVVETEDGILNPFKLNDHYQLNLNNGTNQTQIIWNLDGDNPGLLRVRTEIDGNENVVTVADSSGELSELPTPIPIVINSSNYWWWEPFEGNSKPSLPELLLDKWEILF